MDPKAMESALLEVAARAGVSVRHEDFDAGTFAHVARRGGLCWIAGQPSLLVDRSLSVVERVAVLADGLSGVDVERISMAPAVRERIETSARRRAAAASRGRPRLRRVV